LPEQWSQHKEDCIELVGISIQRKKRAIGRWCTASVCTTPPGRSPVRRARRLEKEVLLRYHSSNTACRLWARLKVLCGGELFQAGNGWGRHPLEGNRTGRDEVRPDFVSRRQQSSQDSSCLFFHRREHLHKLLSDAATIVLLAAAVLNVCDAGINSGPKFAQNPWLSLWLTYWSIW
jgi:hypothetical protein